VWGRGKKNIKSKRERRRKKKKNVPGGGSLKALVRKDKKVETKGEKGAPPLREKKKPKKGDGNRKTGFFNPNVLVGGVKGAPGQGGKRKGCRK